MSSRTPAPAPRASPAWGWWLLIFGLTLLAYLPALRAGFIWDDQPGHVTKPELQPLGGLLRIWFEVGATQQYYPLLHSVFWLEHALWGDAPFGYHLVNLLLHATAAGLFGTLLRRLAAPGAWFAALVFAVHPVCVETVAWISEQKNTLSTVLALGSALAYLRFETDRTPGRYAPALLLFIAALLSKTVTATLPAALLVVSWWRRGRLDGRRDVAPLLPWFALSLAAAATTAWVEHAQIGAQGDAFALGPLERGLLAARAAWFYAGKLFWPAPLVFIYPRWTIDAAQLWQWLFVLGAFGALAALWCLRHRTRGPLAVVLLFVGMLFPALGFVNVFPFVYSYVADHFQYAASLAAFAGAAAGGLALTRSLSATWRRTGAIAVLTLLGLLTWRQASIYENVFTLYRATLAQNPTAWMAHNNLGIALADAGRPAEALPHYEQALRLRPGYVEAENNIGYALTQLGRPAEALPHLERALQLRPAYPDAHNNRGAALMALGRALEGTQAFAEAVRLKPTFALAQLNYGRALAAGRNFEEAIPRLRTAVELLPRSAEAHFFLAVALKETGRDAEADRELDAARELGFSPR